MSSNPVVDDGERCGGSIECVTQCFQGHLQALSDNMTTHQMQIEVQETQLTLQEEEIHDLRHTIALTDAQLAFAQSEVETLRDSLAVAEEKVLITSAENCELRAAVCAAHTKAAQDVCQVRREIEALKVEFAERERAQAVVIESQLAEIKSLRSALQETSSGRENQITELRKTVQSLDEGYVIV